MRWFRQLVYFKALIVPLILFLILLLIGTAGYMIIERYSLIEAFYMTVITVATVGYMEVHPLSETGRIFTVVIILINIIAFSFFLTYITRYLLDGELLRQYKRLKMENEIHHLSSHVIVCGFGRNGSECAQVLHENRIPFVVLEEKHDLPPNLPFHVKYFIKGDATKDEILKEAGIERARAIICTMPIDADNLFTVITARQLNAGITIISRASQDNSVVKLKVGGANNVIMPDKIGGAHMATLVMNPDVLEMLSLMTTRNTPEFKVSEIMATRTVSLGELELWKSSGCTLLGVKSNNSYKLNPAPDYYLKPGERLIVMGSEEQIKLASKTV
ncbi:MAG: NAD-binding protein [Chitinophagaceae bacterium]|nr:NAD-binding protein [Chitinophagaceae bacterium]